MGSSRWVGYAVLCSSLASTCPGLVLYHSRTGQGPLHDVLMPGYSFWLQYRQSDLQYVDRTFGEGISYSCHTTRLTPTRPGRLTQQCWQTPWAGFH
jgi:hypothetical protein